MLADVFTTLLPVRSGGGCSPVPPDTSRQSSSHRWLPSHCPGTEQRVLPPQPHAALSNCLLCLGLIRPICLHRRHGVLLPQRPQGCASIVSTAETKHPEAATTGPRAELLSRGHFTTTESFSMPSGPTCTPAFHIHHRHRHRESRDRRSRTPKTMPKYWSLEIPSGGLPLPCVSLLAAGRSSPGSPSPQPKAGGMKQG